MSSGANRTLDSAAKRGSTMLNLKCVDVQTGLMGKTLLELQSNKGDILPAYKTSFSVDAILEFLKSIKGCDAMISDDAGRFVCNYVYYHSLRFVEEKGHKSLFVHVPPFSRINEEAQMQFMISLLEAIASTC